jgi:hypothetical protein
MAEKEKSGTEFMRGRERKEERRRVKWEKEEWNQVEFRNNRISEQLQTPIERMSDRSK